MGLLRKKLILFKKLEYWKMGLNYSNNIECRIVDNFTNFFKNLLNLCKRMYFNNFKSLTMKIKIILFSLLLLLTSLTSSADTQFKQSIGFPDASAEFLSGCETPDSGYVFLGNTTDTVSKISKLFLVKMDLQGSLLWNKTYEFPIDAFGIKVAATPNGELVMMGYTFLDSIPYDDIFLIRTQSDGTILWSNTYGGNDIDEGNDMIIDAQGNIVVAGYTYSFGSALKSGFVLKTDGNGIYSWSKTYSQNVNQEFNGISQTSDYGYILSGYTQAPPGINFDGYIVKTDSAGGINWSKRTGGSLSEILYKGWQDATGDFYFAGFFLRHFKRIHATVQIRQPRLAPVARQPLAETLVVVRRRAEQLQ